MSVITCRASSRPHVVSLMNSLQLTADRDPVFEPLPSADSVSAEANHSPDVCRRKKSSKSIAGPEVISSPVRLDPTGFLIVPGDRILSNPLESHSHLFVDRPRSSWEDGSVS